MKVRGEFRISAQFEDVTAGWTDEEKQALRDRDEGALEEAGSRLLRLSGSGIAEVDDEEVEVDA